MRIREVHQLFVTPIAPWRHGYVGSDWQPELHVRVPEVGGVRRGEPRDRKAAEHKALVGTGYDGDPQAAAVEHPHGCFACSPERVDSDVLPQSILPFRIVERSLLLAGKRPMLTLE